VQKRLGDADAAAFAQDLERRPVGLDAVFDPVPDQSKIRTAFSRGRLRRRPRAPAADDLGVVVLTSLSAARNDGATWSPVSGLLSRSSSLLCSSGGKLMHDPALARGQRAARTVVGFVVVEQRRLAPAEPPRRACSAGGSGSPPAG
jgi:hypothetical protein